MTDRLTALPILAAPKRIQRQRTKGYRLPPDAVYVGRPSRWGNPFNFDSAFVSDAAMALGAKDPREAAVLLHRAWVRGQRWIEPLSRWTPRIEFTEGSSGGSVWIQGRSVTHVPKVPNLSQLRGRDLACWCPLTNPGGTPYPCHADVLLELANR